MSQFKSRLSLLSGASIAAAMVCAASAFAADTTNTIAAGTTQTTVVTASPAAPDTYTLNILGTLRPTNANNVTNLTVQGSGAGAVVINNGGRWQGRMDFTAASGPITVNLDAGADPLDQGWNTGGTNTFGAGADLLNIEEGGVLATTGATTLNFAAGSDALTSTGRVIVDRVGNQTGTLTLSGLETFDNSGLILMGSFFGGAGEGLASDRGSDDRLSALGVAFTGAEGSRIAMDVRLGARTQVGCLAIAATDLAADCIDFTGGSTAGSTLLTIQDTVFTEDAGLNSGIDLILGSSAAENFTLDPTSAGYVRTSLGGVIQKQLVAYKLVYDETDQKHMLVGLPADEGVQAATFAVSAQETWRAATGSWFDRQADLRVTPGGLESSKGFWARGGFSSGNRDGEASVDAFGSTYTYDTSHSQRIAHLMFGADLLGAVSQDGAWVIGAMGGLSRTDVEYDATPTEVTYTGFNGGLYASWISGPLFVDAVFSGSVLDLNAEVPNMRLDDNVNLTQTVKSYGAQVEAGWRVDLQDGFFIEPLAGLSYVSTKIEDIDVPGGGGSFDFEDSYTSSRLGAGLRLGMDSQMMGHAATFSLTGRYWNEGEGVNDAVIRINNGATATPVSDDFSGGFTDIAANVSLYSDDGAVSGFLKLGGQFADGYQSAGGSLGVRLRW